MAVIEVILNQEFYGQLCVNRFHYVSQGTPAAVTNAYAAIAAMGFLQTEIITGNFKSDTLAAALQNLQSTALRYVSVFARDLYSVSDFYEVPYSIAVNGTEPGEAMSPAVAFGFSSSRVRTDIRRGMKRFAGVSEGMVTTGGIIRSDVVGELTAVSAKLSAALTYDDEGNTLTFVPAILGVEEYVTPSGNRAYRPYATEAAQLAHIAQGIIWSHYNSVRTQVSRQYGRGV